MQTKLLPPSKHTLRAALAALALAALAAPAAWASVDTSPQPGGVYRLKPGIYVAEESACAAPPNAALRRYDGKGIATAHTRACKAVVRARRHERYSVSQTCTDTASGRRLTQRQELVVQDALTFTQVLGGNATTYRYCPPYQLPRDLRKAAR